MNVSVLNTPFEKQTFVRIEKKAKPKYMLSKEMCLKEESCYPYFLIYDKVELWTSI